MITGPEELIRSQGGRTAIAMREKSAGESMVLLTALAAHCKQRKSIPYLITLPTVFKESRDHCNMRHQGRHYLLQ